MHSHSHTRTRTRIISHTATEFHQLTGLHSHMLAVFSFSLLIRKKTITCACYLRAFARNFTHQRQIETSSVYYNCCVCALLFSNGVRGKWREG